MTAFAPSLLTAREACDALRVSRSTLGRMIARGDLRAVRLGSPGTALRVPVTELERVLTVNTTDDEETAK